MSRKDVLPALPTHSLRFSADHLAWGSEVWSEWLQKVQHSPKHQNKSLSFGHQLVLYPYFFLKKMFSYACESLACISMFLCLAWCSWRPERALDFLEQLLAPMWVLETKPWFSARTAVFLILQPLPTCYAIPKDPLDRYLCLFSHCSSAPSPHNPLSGCLSRSRVTWEKDNVAPQRGKLPNWRCLLVCVCACVHVHTCEKERERESS